MRIVHAEGSFEVANVMRWLAYRAGLSPAEQAEKDAIVSNSVITDDNGVPLSEPELSWVRTRLLDVYAGMPESRTFADQLREFEAKGGMRYFINRYWPWGTYPSLGGNSKAGKSTFIAALIAYLLTPGRMFLGRFEPANLTDEERGRGVWLINTEMNGDAYLQELIKAGVDPHAPLTITNLLDEGGPAMFDLTDPYIYGRWVKEFNYCESCDGSDFIPPVVVIVDNLTSILQATGKPLEHYGELHGKFVQLMAEIDCPNGMTVVHNTLAGTHAMGGTTGQNRPDGLWNYYADKPDKADSKRYFTLVPRMGGEAVPTTRVHMDADGHLYLSPEPEAEVQSDDPEAVHAETISEIAERIAAYVEANPGADGQMLTDNIEAPSKGDNLAGRAKAVEDGLITEARCGVGVCSICERPHHRRVHYWPVTR